ncbi:MAG: hypothetical protein A2107_15560 [Verrucomicrobia bacterium GWF2_62_7]|nr:MAG: hypothetical protein A2107_15560 [Verrucomicrobia bacterium GWF2_62_7]
MKSPQNTRRLVLVGLSIGALVIGSITIVPPLKRISEFGRTESVKGYWLGLQDFVKQNGRYPKDNAEIAAFFSTAPEKEPVVYMAPHDNSADEVVLWWKQKTMFGVTIGITESGVIVKR